MTSETNFEQQAKDYFFQLKTSIEKIELTNGIGDWINRSQVMKFMQYGDTQMRELENSGHLTISQIGRRKFILKKSLNDFLHKQVIISSRNEK